MKKITNGSTLINPDLLGLFGPLYFGRLRERIVKGLFHMFPELRLRKLVGDGVAIHSTTRIVERVALYELAYSSIKVGRFIEVGSYLGATAVILAAALRKFPGGKVYCVDTWENDAMSEGKWNTYEVFCQNIQPWKQTVVPIKGRSNSVELPFDEEVDLVFIDGDHAYGSVKKDVIRFGRLVRPNGYLVMHDQAYYPSVTKVVGELLDGGGWYIAYSVQNITALRKSLAWTVDTEAPVATNPVRT